MVGIGEGGERADGGSIISRLYTKLNHTLTLIQKLRSFAAFFFCVHMSAIFITTTKKMCGEKGVPKFD